jgi:hypothetical protein
VGDLYVGRLGLAAVECFAVVCGVCVMLMVSPNVAEIWRPLGLGIPFVAMLAFLALWTREALMATGEARHWPALLWLIPGATALAAGMWITFALRFPRWRWTSTALATSSLLLQLAAAVLALRGVSLLHHHTSCENLRFGDCLGAGFSDAFAPWIFLGLGLSVYFASFLAALGFVGVGTRVLGRNPTAIRQ